MKVFKDYFIENVKKFKNRVCLHDGSMEITWETLYGEINALGTWLCAQKPRQKICVLGENSYEWILVHLSGILGAGIIIPMDKDLPCAELCRHAEMVEADILFVSSQYEDKAQAIVNARPQCKSVLMDTAAFTAILEEGKQLLNQGDSGFISLTPQPEECASITFTSGTTSEAKGVMLSQKNLLTCAKGTIHSVDLKDGDRFLLVLPLHHIYACFVNLYGMLLFGCTLCICRDMKRFLSLIKEYHTNKMFLVPLLAEAVLNQLKRSGKSPEDFFGFPIEWMVVGGAKMPPASAKELIEAGIPVLEGYGITEASSFTTVNPFQKMKLGSVGICPQDWKIKISSSGEVLTFGDNLMMGYLNGSSEELFEDGWLKTGDIGHLDEDQYLFIDGRKKNVIVQKNGKNIFPEELESQLQSIGGVEEVLVYEQDQLLTAEYYAPEEADMKEKMETWNKELPAYKRIQKFVERTTPFERSGSQKIKRKQTCTKN